jgi:glyoxalase family protein
MKLDGIHHVTCIPGDAPQTVASSPHTLRPRMVKKPPPQHDPTVYHLSDADERGSAGADITFFEYPGVSRGLAGDGMVHRIVFRVGSDDALDFWEARVGGTRNNGSLVFDDPEGLTLELAIDTSGNEPLVAAHPEIPEEHALRGFAGVRAYASEPETSTRCLASPGFEPGWR